jgi:hypothetical protein
MMVIRNTSLGKRAYKSMVMLGTGTDPKGDWSPPPTKIKIKKKRINFLFLAYLVFSSIADIQNDFNCHNNHSGYILLAALIV